MAELVEPTLLVLLAATAEALQAVLAGLVAAEAAAKHEGAASKGKKCVQHGASYKLMCKFDLMFAENMRFCRTTLIESSLW